MDFNFSDSIHIKLERVVYRFKVPKNYSSHGRDTNGFIYYVKGGHRFNFADRSITTQSGDFVYIPYHAVYTNTLLSDDTEYYQVDFLLYNNTEPCCLFDDFQVINGNKATDYFLLIKEIYKLYFLHDSSYKISCIGNICKLINMMTHKSEQEELKQKGLDTIYKSLSYIKEHYNEETSVEKLAEISHISVSNLEKTFKKCYGMTPIVYRNTIRIEEAKKLLLNGFSIAETCIRTGFAGRYYYFCKMFKKYVGVSPGKYVAENSKT